MTEAQSYSLGASEAELARLDAQAASIATPTALFLGRAGVAAGMRVLDLGTGLGHVAFLLSELVGAAGEVVGIDQAAPMLAVAEQRRVAAASTTFDSWRPTFHVPRHEAFDAVVGRLILFHLADPVEVLRHHLGGLADDGVMLMIDFDVGSARSEPPAPLFNTARDWVIAAFRHAGANPIIGTQLGRLLRDAGLTDIDTFGLQRYLTADDRSRPALLSSCRQEPRAGDRRRRNRYRGRAGARHAPGTTRRRLEPNRGSRADTRSRWRRAESARELNGPGIPASLRPPAPECSSIPSPKRCGRHSPDSPAPGRRGRPFAVVAPWRSIFADRSVSPSTSRSPLANGAQVCDPCPVSSQARPRVGRGNRRSPPRPGRQKWGADQHPR